MLAICSSHRISSSRTALALPLLPLKMSALPGWDFLKDVSTKVRVDVRVSSAESVFQGRVGRKWDLFRHCRSTVSYSFRRFIYMLNLGHIWGDMYRRRM